VTRTPRTVVGALLLLAACGRVDAARGGAADASVADASLADSTVPLEQRPREVSITGAFALRDIRESSAAVRSFAHEGVYWTLNDSGNDERLFAFDTAGRDLGTVRVTGARNRDWEAMATGPCPEGRCLVVGDVGDNFARHESVTLWRIPEPAPPGAGREAASAPARPLALRFPDGPRDVEALWVDADTAVWLVTKREVRGDDGARRRAQVYRVPARAWEAGTSVDAELVDSLPHIATRNRRTLITDAALANPFGDAALPALLAVRTYELLLVFRTEPGSGRPLELVGHCALDALGEAQGEGVAWLPDGRVLLTSEKRRAPLHALRCP
jgi:hypothetical protein